MSRPWAVSAQITPKAMATRVMPHIGKYGIQAKVLTLGSKIGSIFGRDATNTTILLTFDD